MFTFFQSHCKIPSKVATGSCHWVFLVRAIRDFISYFAWIIPLSHMQTFGVKNTIGWVEWSWQPLLTTKYLDCYSSRHGDLSGKNGKKCWNTGLIIKFLSKTIFATCLFFLFGLLRRHKYVFKVTIFQKPKEKTQVMHKMREKGSKCHSCTDLIVRIPPEWRNENMNNQLLKLHSWRSVTFYLPCNNFFKDYFCNMSFFLVWSPSSTQIRIQSHYLSKTKRENASNAQDEREGPHPDLRIFPEMFFSESILLVT